MPRMRTARGGLGPGERRRGWAATLGCVRKLLTLGFVCIVLAPVGMSAHGVEFLSARLTLLPDAEVLLEVTADYGSNPMLVDETSARAALADPIRLREGDALVPLAERATPHVAENDDWEEFAPAAYLPDDAEGQAHQLLTSAWRWRSTTPEIIFEMPKGKKHDVLLWTRDQSDAKAPPRWMLLLGGDRSKAIAVAWPPWWRRNWPTMMALGVFGLVGGGYLISRIFTLRQRTL